MKRRLGRGAAAQIALFMIGAAFYACAPSSNAGERGDAGGALPDGVDATAYADAPAPGDDGSASPVDAAPNDVDVTDASSDTGVELGDGGDGGTCMTCGGTAAPDHPFCAGGCDWYTGPGAGLFSQDYRHVCHSKCNGVCPVDPPYAGVCPPACTGGCAGGVCNIMCDGSDPALSCRQITNAFWQLTTPAVKCPEGLPCKVTCRNAGCYHNIIACPRGGASCEIDCGESSGCAHAHLFCGAGRCNVHGDLEAHDRKDSFPEYNFAADVCGPSCSCDVPFKLLMATASAVRCQCKDYQLLKAAGTVAADVCPAVCASHGGWSVPWERVPNAW